MKNIEIEILKSLFFDYWKNIVIVVLCFFLFKSCQGERQTALAMETQIETTKQYVKNSDGFVAKVDSLKKVSAKLKKDIALIKNDSIARINEIAALKTKVNTQLAAIKTYSTNDIAKHYQGRYNDKKGVVVTQYGVALSDGIAKQNLSELSVCDGAKTEMEVVKTDLQTQKRIVGKQDQYIAVSDESFRVLQLAKTEKDKAFESQQATIKTAEKGIRKERNKKNFWKVTSGVILAGAGYLLITQ